MLPAPTHDEALESAAIASAAGRGDGSALEASRTWGIRPFRAPHHSASAIALVGGGGVPRPGEVSLAHNGVLFLDELPEWSRIALEVLREPLESGTVTVSRAARSVEFPARFQLVAAMNPCPCGWAGDASGRCRCSEESIERYRSRVSGPLMDRIDMHVEVPRLPSSELRTSAAPGESSATVAARVAQARHVQLGRAGQPNARLTQAELRQACVLSASDQSLLDAAADRLQLSARSVHRVLRVARTIADLDASDAIQTHHLTEAIGYRRVDRGAAR